MDDQTFANDGPPSSAIVPRTTIGGLVSRRDAAFAHLVEARDRLHEALDAAREAGAGAWPGLGDKLTRLLLSRNERDGFIDAARRQIDAAAWNNVVFTHGFERIMDRQALDEFRGQLDRDPPVFDLETADATMRQLVLDADRLMRRGVANAFSKLDRRFRSHDGFTIGSRVVLDHAFSESGSWNHHRRHDDVIRDVERALLTLDGQEVPDRYAGIVGLVDQARSGHWSPFACHIENDHLRIRTFKNGNAHLWFKRDDLLRRINRLLAEHYGEVLGDASEDVCSQDPLATNTTAVARNMGWFPTPGTVARKVAGQASVDWARGRSGEAETVLRTLEPSAGEGALAEAVIEAAARGAARIELVCVELHRDRAAALRRAGLDGRNGHRVIERDFLSLSPDETGLFDRIVMNPPFDRQNDVAHVVHASKFLAPGGRLVAIMASSIEFRDDARSVAFRRLVERMDGDIIDLPAGSFEESGTSINTCMVTLNAPRT